MEHSGIPRCSEEGRVLGIGREAENYSAKAPPLLNSWDVCGRGGWINPVLKVTLKKGVLYLGPIEKACRCSKWDSNEGFYIFRKVPATLSACQNVTHVFL